MPASVPNTGQQVASHWRRLCGWISNGIFGFLGTTVLISLGISILSTWFTSPKGIIPADSPLVRLLTQWPLLLIVGCFLLVLAILARVFSRGPTQSATTLLTTQNRAFMLQRLRYSYRTLIDTSLQGAARVELGLANKPDAVQNTSTFLLRSLNKPERMHPPGSSILDVYEQAAHELLILGKGGAGKSTLLYQLGLHLVEQAEQDEMFPLPILLPLSSWAVKRLPLQEWMIEQLSSPLYEIPRQVGQQWVQHQQILPLLDGLDEMETSARSACITAINVYHHEHMHPLVVCSRSEEYVASHKRLALQSAVIVQPLTNQQIDDVLIQGDKLLAVLRSKLQGNSELRNLARSPLLLNILLLTYQGTAVHSLPKKRSMLQKQIFTAYVERMMQYKGNAERYPHAQTIIWLCWLAGQMRRQNQTIFYLELLQPDWLSTKSRSFYRWSIALIFPLFIMLFGVASWTLLAILFSWLLRGRVEVSLEGVLGTIPTGLIAGLVFGLFLGQRPIRAAEFLTWSWKDIWFRLLVGFAFGLTGGGAFMLLHRLITRISGQQLTERLHLTPNEGIRVKPPYLVVEHKAPLRRRTRAF